jgi:hypothetical protein
LHHFKLALPLAVTDSLFAEVVDPDEQSPDLNAKYNDDEVGEEKLIFPESETDDRDADFYKQKQSCPSQGSTRRILCALIGRYRGVLCRFRGRSNGFVGERFVIHVSSEERWRAFAHN